MDNRRYQELRTYCVAELGENMNRPGYDATMKFAVKMGVDTGRIKREEQLARHLFQCNDLTTRERAAAYLLAVITNHRVATWQREASPPNGQETMPPLDKVQADELDRVTTDAVTRYAAFLPEREAAVLMADCEQPAPAQDTAPTAPVVTAEASDGVTPGKRTNYLTPAIQIAQSKCAETNKFNAPAIFAKLRDMALAKSTPFIGVSDEGLKWLDSNDEAHFLSLANLRDRLNRQKTNSAKT